MDSRHNINGQWTQSMWTLDTIYMDSGHNIFGQWSQSRRGLIYLEVARTYIKEELINYNSITGYKIRFIMIYYI